MLSKGLLQHLSSKASILQHSAFFIVQLSHPYMTTEKTIALPRLDQSHHFTANRRGEVEAVTDFIFLGSKITTDGDYSHEIKRRLLLGRKVMTHLDSILKNRDMTLPTKVHLVKAMVFPGVMYGCESCTVKKAEHQRIDAFKLLCWRRVLKVSWTTGD